MLIQESKIRNKDCKPENIARLGKFLGVNIEQETQAIISEMIAKGFVEPEKKFLAPTYFRGKVEL